MWAIPFVSINGLITMAYLFFQAGGVAGVVTVLHVVVAPE